MKFNKKLLLIPVIIAIVVFVGVYYYYYNEDDNSLNVHGDFMITNITIPLGAGNTMSVSGSEVSMDRYF